MVICPSPSQSRGEIEKVEKDNLEITKMAKTSFSPNGVIPKFLTPDTKKTQGVTV